MRQPNWDTKLADYIAKHRNTEFSWGVNDCLTFSNGATREITGVGLLDCYVGGYKTARGAIGRAKRAGDLVAKIDAVLQRHEGFPPPRGSLILKAVPEAVGIGYALGVMASGLDAAFMTEQGVRMIRADRADKVWALP